MAQLNRCPGEASYRSKTAFRYLSSELLAIYCSHIGITVSGNINTNINTNVAVGLSCWFLFAQNLADNIPGAELNLYEDRGHLFILSRDCQDETSHACTCFWCLQ